LRKTETPEGRKREFVISSEVKDRHRTILKADGIRLDNYMRNPVVMYAHAANRKPDPDLVIGTGSVSQEGTKTIGVIDFEEGNTIADKVLSKIDKGILRATSVGFDPIKSSWGDEERGEDPDTYYFREWDLLEFSVVPVPSNPEALKRDIMDYIDEQGKEVVIKDLDVEKKDITGGVEFDKDKTDENRKNLLLLRRAEAI